MELKAKYEQRIEQAEAELRQVKNKILRISTLRVLLFAAGIIGTIYFYQAGTPTICLTIAVTFVPFLALVKYHNRLFFRKDWLETCIRVNSDELSALADNYEPLRTERNLQTRPTGILLTWTCSEGTLCFRP